MTTAFGPQGPNYTTTRPARDPEASGGLDSWFKNCSGPGAKDGTFATADFFNVLVGNIRSAVRESGITLDNTDDDMLYKAIKAIADAEIATAVPTAITASHGLKLVGGDVRMTLGTADATIIT